VKIPPPPDFKYREFGFMLWDKDVMVRHKSFSDAEQLQNFLAEYGPKHAYRSVAYYYDPEASTMESKGWIGADLVFDVDADHLNTPCKMEHDFWVCEHCGAHGRGGKPEQCHKCGSSNIKEFTWICERCLDLAKEEIIKLKDFLIDDFGISPYELKIVYSGHRGYHLHVYSEVVRDLTRDERREMLDYIKGIGLSVSSFYRKSSGVIIFEREGWGGRILKSLENLLRDEDGLTALKDMSEMDRSTLEKLRSYKSVILRGLREESPKIILPKGVGEKTLIKLLAKALKMFEVEVDEPVTIDVHRIIRLENSLHGKTGFRVTEIPLNYLDKFDAFKDAIVFRGEVSIKFLFDCPPLRIGEEVFGPFKRGQKVEVPMALAIFVLARGVAILL